MVFFGNLLVWLMVLQIGRFHWEVWTTFQRIRTYIHGLIMGLTRATNGVNTGLIRMTKGVNTGLIRMTKGVNTGLIGMTKGVNTGLAHEGTISNRFPAPTRRHPFYPHLPVHLLR
jgi:hypothetical protein